MTVFDEKPRGVSYSVTEVLPFLTAQPFNEVAKSWIHSLRPSRVEVLQWNEGHNLLAMNWRVRVYIHDDRILRIEQEVEVGLYGDVRNGADAKTLAFEQFATQSNRTP